MIDSTNPRIMADNIRELNTRMISNDVEANPSGSGFNTLLTKMKIDGKKYKLPNQVTANPTGEASDEISKIDIGGTVYSLGGGGGYSPNYSETEAEVGYSVNNNPVYGRLIPVTGNSIESSWGAVNSSLTFEDIDLLLKAELFFKDSSSEASTGFLLTYIGTSDHKLYGKSFATISMGSAGPKYLYIEYTKVTTP